MKVLWFIGFLVAYVVFVIATLWLVGQTVLRSQEGNKKQRLGLIEFAPILVSSVFIIAFIVLTTHEFDVTLAGGILVATFVSIALDYFLGGISKGEYTAILAKGFEQERARELAAPAGSSGWRKQPLEQRLSLLVLLAFFGVVGWLYFSMSVPSPAASAALSNTIVGGMAILTLFQAAFAPRRMLTSKYLDEDTRIDVLVKNILSVIYVAGLMSVVLWRTHGQPAETLSAFIERNLSLLIVSVAVVLLFFVICFIVPYFRGSADEEQWQADLDEFETNALAEVQNVLSRPAPLQIVSQRLAEAKTKVEAQIETIRTEEGLGLLDDYMRELMSSELLADQLRLDIFKLVLPRDPRFRHLEQLIKVSEDIDALRERLAQPGVTEATVESLGASYSRVQSAHLGELDKRKRPRRLALLSKAGLLTGLTPIINIIGGGEFAKLLVQLRHLIGLP
jgi:hypothetical protein